MLHSPLFRRLYTVVTFLAVAVPWAAQRLVSSHLAGQARIAVAVVAGIVMVFDACLTFLQATGAAANTPPVAQPKGTVPMGIFRQLADVVGHLAGVIDNNTAAVAAVHAAVTAPAPKPIDVAVTEAATAPTAPAAPAAIPLPAVTPPPPPPAGTTLAPLGG